MLKIIKWSFFILLSAIVISAIIKDKIFDTPIISKQKITPYLIEASKNDIGTNIFKTKKTYVYKMYYWSIVPLGELRFKTQVDDLGNVFSFEASTEKSFAQKFISAKATIESYYSKNTRLPYKYAEKTEVNGKIKTKEIIFDQANLITTRDNKKFKIPFETYDPISAFVHMLTLSLEIGREQKTKFVSGEDLYILKSTVLNESNGIDEILIDMRRENLTSSHGATFHVWVTSDNARIPLVFKCWSPVGYVSVILGRVE